MAAMDVHQLRALRPEWIPWLTLVERVGLEASNASWDRAVPETLGGGPEDAPLLAHASVSLERTELARWLDDLAGAAVPGTPLVAAGTALRRQADAVALFTASVCQHRAIVDAVAATSGADPQAVEAMVALIAVPFLQACNRRSGAAVSAHWLEGYCPVCGAWPVFAEVRGIERQRYLRCGRCGGAWLAHPLRCPYCATTDHKRLLTLVPDDGAGHAAIEACTVCRGYVKTFTMLQGCPPGSVMLNDLASVDLDFASLEHGYTRPQDAGFELDVAVAVRSTASGRAPSWNV